MNDSRIFRMKIYHLGFEDLDGGKSHARYQGIKESKQSDLATCFFLTSLPICQNIDDLRGYAI